MGKIEHQPARASRHSARPRVLFQPQRVEGNVFLLVQLHLQLEDSLRTALGMEAAEVRSQAKVQLVKVLPEAPGAVAKPDEEGRGVVAPLPHRLATLVVKARAGVEPDVHADGALGGCLHIVEPRPGDVGAIASTHRHVPPAQLAPAREALEVHGVNVELAHVGAVRILERRVCVLVLVCNHPAHLGSGNLAVP
eukprot:UN4701